MTYLQKLDFLEKRVAEQPNIPIRTALEIKNKIELARLNYETNQAEFHKLLGFIHGTMLGGGNISFEEHETLSH